MLVPGCSLAAQICTFHIPMCFDLGQPDLDILSNIIARGCVLKFTEFVSFGSVRIPNQTNIITASAVVKRYPGSLQTQFGCVSAQKSVPWRACEGPLICMRRCAQVHTYLSYYLTKRALYYYTRFPPHFRKLCSFETSNRSV